MKTNKGRFGRTSALAGVLLYFPIASYWTRITEWMLRGADSSHGSLLAQAMELCTRKYGRWPMAHDSGGVLAGGLRKVHGCEGFTSIASYLPELRHRIKRDCF